MYDITDCSNYFDFLFIILERNDFKLLEMFQLELELIFYVGVCCSIEQIIWNRISSPNRASSVKWFRQNFFLANLELMQILFIATD